MSPLVVLALVLIPVVLTVAVFVAVVIGIHSEPRHEMTTTAQRPLAAMVRRLLGVYVGKPADVDTDDREDCLTGPSTDWWNRGGGDQ